MKIHVKYVLSSSIKLVNSYVCFNLSRSISLSHTRTHTRTTHTHANVPTLPQLVHLKWLFSGQYPHSSPFSLRPQTKHHFWDDKRYFFLLFFFLSFSQSLSLILSLSHTHSQYLFPLELHTHTHTHFWTIWKKSDTDFMFVLKWLDFIPRYSIHILIIIGYSIEDEERRNAHVKLEFDSIQVHDSCDQKFL